MGSLGVLVALWWQVRMLWRRRRARQRMMQHARQLYIAVINRYRTCAESLVRGIEKQFQGKVVLRVVGEGDFEAAHKEFVGKIVAAGENPLSYAGLSRFVAGHQEVFPDLVILCGDQSIFQTSAPFLLYSAELRHYREEFSEKVVVDALRHYFACKIRNGK